MKLYFKYGAMNSGKTMELLRTAYNYEENGFKTFVIKPICDTKGDDFVISRVGYKRKVEYSLKEDELLSNIIKDDIDVVLVDEAEFLTREQVDDLLYIAKFKNIDVFCYGLKSDFRTNAFPGSIRLFELADKIEEVSTLCKCGDKAMFNLRMVNGVPIFTGEQVLIDGFYNTTYMPVCARCYLKAKEHYEDNSYNNDNSNKNARVRKG